MSTEKTSAASEISILQVIQELERGNAAPLPEQPKASVESTEVAQAQQLKASLERKRELVRLLNGYTDVGDISQKIDVALAELDAIINA